MRKKVLFLAPESETFYLRCKYLYLIRELLSRYNVEVIIGENPTLYQFIEKSWLSKFKEVSLFKAEEAKKNIPISERNKYLASTKEAIEDIRVSPANIELWKLLVLDDLAGSIVQEFHKLPEINEEVGAVITPLYHTNRAQGFGSYYQFQLYKTCREKGIPTVGVEFQQLSDYYYYHYYFYDFYIVKQESSSFFLQGKLGVSESQIFLLKEKYTPLLTDTTLPPQAILKLFEDIESFSKEIYSGTPLITVVHSISERYSVRRLIRILSKISMDFNLIIVTHPSNSVLFLKEREIVLEAYVDELSRSRFKEMLNLDTPRHSPEFFSIFSDLVIYTEPAEVNNHLSLPENVVYYSPLRRKENTRTAILNDAQLISYVENKLRKDKKRKTFRECIESIIEEA